MRWPAIVGWHGADQLDSIPGLILHQVLGTHSCSSLARYEQESAPEAETALLQFPPKITDISSLACDRVRLFGDLCQ